MARAWVSLGCLGGVILCLLTQSSLGQQASTVGDKKIQIAGTWNFQSGKRAGEDIPSDRFPASITISDDVITIAPAEDFVFRIKYAIDAAKSPAMIDLEIIEGPAEQTKSLGIVQLRDGLLTLCYDPTGESRPERFESTADNGAFLFVLKRQVAEFDAAKLEGTWEIKSGHQAGEAMEPERYAAPVQLTKDAFRIPAGEAPAYIMAYTVDATRSPVTIDMELVEGPAPGAKAVGILKLEDDKLSMCYDPTGQNRPTEFKSTAENGCFLFVMQRVKSN